MECNECGGVEVEGFECRECGQGGPDSSPDSSPCSAAAVICENYIEILRDERDQLAVSETSILRSLANKEIDRLNRLVEILKRNGGAQTSETEE